MVQGCNTPIANLQKQIDYLTKKLFGTSSEQSKDISGQLSLFSEAEQGAVPEDPETIDREFVR
ncbi:MAG: transposase [Eubacteriales bacterium]|nr:transposase [Eubacteriales bacterium]